MIEYRLLKALKVALPMLPLQVRDGAPWIDYKRVRAEYADVLAVMEMLAPHDLASNELPINLRELTRRIAPWWTTMDRTALQALDGGPVAMVPLDPDAMFRGACARVVSQLGTESISPKVAACLGPEAALGCAEQVSPLVCYVLEIPAIRSAFDTLDSDKLPSREASGAARDALGRALSIEMCDDAPLAFALTELLYTSQANSHAWTLVAECARMRERARGNSDSSTRRA